MSDRQFVCRCEDVNLHEIESALAAGLSTIEEIKRYTGLGTGPCQGKECVATLVRIMIARGSASAETLVPFTSRPPAEPVTFAALATVPSSLLERGELDPLNIRSRPGAAFERHAPRGHVDGGDP